MSHRTLRVLVLAPALLLDTAFAADLLGRLLGAEALWTAGAHLGGAGVAAGLAAGLPAGVVAARGRRFRFAVLYLAGVALFALARWVRGDAAVPPEAVLVALEGTAAALAYAGAWAGGLLGGGEGEAVSA